MRCKPLATDEIDPHALYSFSAASQYIPGWHGTVSLSSMHRWREGKRVIRPEEVAYRETPAGNLAWFILGSAILRLAMKDQVPAVVVSRRPLAERKLGWERARQEAEALALIVETT